MATLSKMSSTDFLEQTLYVFRGEANSNEATALARKCPSVAVVDVAQMAQLPAFINGVPILQVRKTGTVHRGSACIGFLHELLKVQVVPAPNLSSGFASSIGITHGRAFEHAGAVDGNMVNGIDFQDETPAVGAGRVGDSDINAYMQRRNEHTELAKNRRGNQAGTLPQAIKSG
jgi:hypothetical protein